MIGMVFVPAVAWGAPREVVEPTGSVRENLTTLVELPMPMHLEEAAVAAAQLDADVLGYRYDNGSLVGEFYPGPDNTPESFLAMFAREYDSEPRVVGVVATFESADAADSAEMTPSSRRRSFEPPAINTATLDGTLQNLSGNNPGVDNSSVGRPTSMSSGSEWRADAVGVAVTEAGATDTRVHFDQAIRWDGAGSGGSPTEIPMGYGVEFAVDAWNDLPVGPAEYWPACQLAADQKFVAFSSGVNWSIYSVGNQSNLADAQPYFDDHVLDSCNRQTFTVGLRYPQLIGTTTEGDYQVLTQIDAPRAGWDTNRISAEHQLVDDVACDLNDDYLSWCMGAGLLSPEGIPAYRMVLSDLRGWHAPDRCWRSVAYGEAPAIPLLTCGQETPTAWVDVNQLVAAEAWNEEGPGWQIEFVHAPGGAINPFSMEYYDSFPGLRDSASENNLRPTVPSDIRMWSHGEEIPVDAFTEWDLVREFDLGRVTLKSPVVNLSRQALTEFLEDGWITFRMGTYGDINTLRVLNLDSSLPAEPSFTEACYSGVCVVGTGGHVQKWHPSGTWHTYSRLCVTITGTLSTSVRVWAHYPARSFTGNGGTVVNNAEKWVSYASLGSLNAYTGPIGTTSAFLPANRTCPAGSTHYLNAGDVFSGKEDYTPTWYPDQLGVGNAAGSITTVTINVPDVSAIPPRVGTTTNPFPTVCSGGLCAKMTGAHEQTWMPSSTWHTYTRLCFKITGTLGLTNQLWVHYPAQTFVSTGGTNATLAKAEALLNYQSAASLLQPYTAPLGNPSTYDPEYETCPADTTHFLDYADVARNGIKEPWSPGWYPDMYGVGTNEKVDAAAIPKF